MDRILFVNLEGVIGGAETSLLLMVKYLRSQFLISVACPAGSPLSRSLASIQVDSYDLPKPPHRACLSLFLLGYWLKTTYCLTRIALKANPDVIHANSFYAGPVSILAALVTRKKLLLHARDLTDFGFLSKFCSWFCEKVIAVSHVVENALIDQRVNPEKIEVVYNGVDNVLLDQCSENGILFSSSNFDEKSSFIFAHVAQFVPWKNHIAFLKAASRVARDLPNTRFILVGDDIFGRDSSYKSSLLSYAENSAIAERVSFLGWQESMNEVWSSINCLVHTAEREPFGRVIIEAMAHKIPVIAVGSCGPSEIIQEGKTGILVQPDDIEGLSEAMLKLAQNTQFANMLANAGHEHAISSFTADKTAALIQEIYEEVLAT
jgi:glycosyltransferase involved in cell wall biosynthesis